MTVRWDRVVGLALVVVGLVFCVVHSPRIVDFFAGMRHIGSHDREQHMMGVIAFGVLMIMATVVGRLVLYGRR